MWVACLHIYLNLIHLMPKEFNGCAWVPGNKIFMLHQLIFNVSVKEVVVVRLKSVTPLKPRRIAPWKRAELPLLPTIVWISHLLWEVLRKELSILLVWLRTRFPLIIHLLITNLDSYSLVYEGAQKIPDLVRFREQWSLQNGLHYTNGEILDGASNFLLTNSLKYNV